MTLGPGPVPDWFEGAIDLHVHSSPSIFPRLLDDREVVRQAAAVGMRALVLKAHEGSTVERAQLVEGGQRSSRLAQKGDAAPAEGTASERQASATLVRGGIVLNRFVGGLNPHAVELALSLGASVVWMPTIHAGNHVDYYGEAGFREQAANHRSRSLEPLSVLDANGKLTRDALEVLEVVAGHPKVVLNNGHLGAKETARLFREARRLGIERLMVAHPELPLSGYSLEFQLEMVRLGATIERCYLPHTSHWGGFPIERTASEIERLGPLNCVISTDFGQSNNPPPAQGLLEFARGLIAHGVSQGAVETMLKRNPAQLLGLD